MQPVLFISHGAPTFTLEPNRTTAAWQSLAASLIERPRVVLWISAHWDGDRARLAGGVSEPRIQYDFFGFPEPFYRLQWPTPSGVDEADWLLARLGELGIQVSAEPAWALDHGVWVPGRCMWPEPIVPSLQLSLVQPRGAAWHFDLGRRLAPLRDEGVLIIGSGGAVHNLGEIDWHAPEGQAVAWARQFADALEGSLATGMTDRLLAPWSQPFGRRAHPTVEHYLPLVVAAAAGKADPCQVLHRNWLYGSLALHMFGWGMTTPPG
ncbi:MAG: 4,5-DOPA dioxygenase extradiol [Rhodocyclaceae bacterium]|nr:4,5-DOPA dioxygenase extradiol [Rhodocyclaceae bacterium]